MRETELRIRWARKEFTLLRRAKGEKTSREHLNPFRESFSKGLFRKICWLLLSQLDETRYYQVTSFLKFFQKIALQKNVRNRSFTLVSNQPSQYSDLSRISGWHEGTLIWTHDIDSIKCQENLQEMLKVETEFGIFSTNHFLTRGRYSLNRALLDSVREKGHEIGLHGASHDIAFGYRSSKHLIETLKKCFKDLSGIDLKSFRAPGYGMTERAGQILHEFGFICDSSVTSGLLYGKELLSPFWLLSENKDKLIYELPVTFSDDRVMRELKLSYREQAVALAYLVEQNRKASVPVVVNIHPGLHGDLDEYRKFLFCFFENMQNRNIKIVSVTASQYVESKL